jgi:hypothetical protein
MKTICQVTLIVVAAFLWVTASSTELGEQTTPTFLFAPQASTGLAPYAVELADMDGDGDLDLVTSNLVDQEFSTVSVSKNNGDGTFAAPVDYPVGPNPIDLRVADFNGDGWPDFVSSIFSPGNRIRVNINRGDGTFFPSVSYEAGGNPSGVGVGDLNGDGKLDIVNSNGSQNDNSISVFIGNGDGTFQPQVWSLLACARATCCWQTSTRTAVVKS